MFLLVNYAFILDMSLSFNYIQLHVIADSQVTSLWLWVEQLFLNILTFQAFSLFPQLPMHAGKFMHVFPTVRWVPVADAFWHCSYWEMEPVSSPRETEWVLGLFMIHRGQWEWCYVTSAKVDTALPRFWEHSLLTSSAAMHAACLCWGHCIPEAKLLLLASCCCSVAKWCRLFADFMTSQ